MVILSALLYLISSSIPNCEHLDNSIDKPVDGVRRMESSGYIRWLVKEDNQHLQSYIIFTKIINVNTHKKVKNSSSIHPIISTEITYIFSSSILNTKILSTMVIQND